MGLFNFQRKLEPLAEFPLEKIPVFAALTPAEQKLIRKKARLLEFKRGDLVYREGEKSEAFYVVISGRFRIFTGSRNKAEGETLLFLYRGDHFGEASLLTGVTHSASVETKRDGIVLKLDKDDFLKFVNDIPSISLHINRSLGHRITRNEDAGGQRREVKIAALYSSENLDQAIEFWFDLSARIETETSRKAIVIDFVERTTKHLSDLLKANQIKPCLISKINPDNESDLKSCITRHPAGFSYLHVPAVETEKASEKKLAALISALTYRFDYILIRHDCDTSRVTFETLKRSDYVYAYCISNADQLVKTSGVLGQFQKNFGFSDTEVKVIVEDPRGESAISYEEKERLLGFKIFSLLPIKSDRLERYESTLGYVARELAGRLVGLALGSGAAYGLSHIGILRVLEREGIPIDVVSGSSIGALIGSFWAAGFDSHELEKIARSINSRNAFFKLVGFRDLSLAHRGFIKGNQVTKFMESFMGDMSFQDLRIPVKVIATNLFDSSEVIFEAGRVVNAIRASISIPGIFRPYEYRGEYLIDGGVIDPLPVRVLSNMGIKKIIAVNVLASGKRRQEAAKRKEMINLSKEEDVLQRNLLSEKVKGSVSRISKRHSVNVFNVIMNTIQFMEYELADAAANEADVLLHPEVDDAHWAQFYQPDKFIEAGRKEVEYHLEEIKQLIAE